MSSSYVRGLARTWASAAATATSIPFYETVNTDQNPSDPVWWTIEFSAEFSEKLSFCDTWREEGIADIVVSGRPGVGDLAVIDASEKIRDNMLSNNDPARKFYLAGPNPPVEYSGGSGELSWYQVSISIEYSYIT